MALTRLQPTALQPSAFSGLNITDGSLYPVDLSSGAPQWATGGSLGLGATPNTWYSTYKALQIFEHGLYASSGGAIGLIYNGYRAADGSYYRYAATQAAQLRLENDGAFKFFTSANGAAGSTISFNQSMTLDTNGNLGLGVTPAAWDYPTLQLQYGSLFAHDYTGNNHQLILGNNYKLIAGTPQYIASSMSATSYTQTNGQHIWKTAGQGTAGNAISFTQVMTIDASGNLSVGSSSEAGRISAVATTGIAGLFKSPSGTSQVNIAHFQNTTNNAYLTVSSAGTTSDVTSWANGSMIIEGVPYSSGNMIIDAYSGSLALQTGRTTRMFINNGGTVSFGNADGSTWNGQSTSCGMYLDTPGSNGFWWAVQTHTNRGYLSKKSGYTDSAFLEFRGPGVVVGTISTNGSTTSYNTTSDYRLKENVEPMVGALETVSRLNPVTYTWKSSGEAAQGFIAHELQEVVPDCVYGDKDEVDADGEAVYQSIDTSFLVATLTAAIKEQQAIIESLKARLDAAGL